MWTCTDCSLYARKSRTVADSIESYDLHRSAKELLKLAFDGCYAVMRHMCHWTMTGSFIRDNCCCCCCGGGCSCWWRSHEPLWIIAQVFNTMLQIVVGEVVTYSNGSNSSRRRHCTDHSIVFARWRQRTPPSSRWFLDPTRVRSPVPIASRSVQPCLQGLLVRVADG